MNTLLLRLAGPMQAWGTQSRFSERDTGLEPSKSGVVGLLCAALGMPRATGVVSRGERVITLADLADLSLAVRVEREGTVERDYHTTGGGGLGVATADSKVRYDAVLSDRYYLADADFLVALGSDDAEFLSILNAALHAPHWPLALGRKAFVPSVPVGVPGNAAAYGPAVREGAAPMDVLWNQPWCAARTGRERGQPPTSLRVVADASLLPGDAMRPTAQRQDVPLSFALGARAFRARAVTTDTIPTPKGDETDVSLAPASLPA